MEITFALSEIDLVAQKVLQADPQKVIVFNAPMGAGKTTFIKALARALGVDGITGSPTFSLVNEYLTTDNQRVYHFDVYRLKSEEEAYDMGLEEYLHSGNWCLIEWAEKIPTLLPEAHSVVTIDVMPDGRRQLTLQ